MSGSTRQFKKKLIYVVPKENLESADDIVTIRKCLHDKHRCVEVVATEEQYSVKFHGVFRDDGSRK